MTKRARFDIEANGLYDTVTKLHCLSFSIMTDGVRGPIRRAVGHNQIIQAWKIICECDEAVAHNGIGYDLFALWKVLKLKLPATVQMIDTFVLSCLIHPDIDAEDGSKHSLEAWGIRLGNHKGTYEEWCILNHIADPWAEYRPEMGDYCDQDVSVLCDLDDQLIKDMQGWDWAPSARMEHQFAKDFQVQAMRGVYIDKVHAEALRLTISKEMVALAAKVEPFIPDRPGTKGQLKETTPPKIQFKKDGSPSAMALKWFDEVKQFSDYIEDQQDFGPATEGTWYGKFEGKWHALPTPADAEGDRLPLRDLFKATLADQQHIKTWLMDCGWIPTMWSFKKAKDAKGKMRFVRGDDKQLIPTWPKFHDKGVLCVNLESINTEFEHVKDVVRWVVIRHRLGLVQSILDALRPDGTVSATGMALGTPTSRVTHKVVANVPKADPTVTLGKECRAMFIARPGRKFTGVDAAGLELRCLGHYVGSPELIEMVCNGSSKDGTDIHSVLAKACFPLVPSRAVQKNVTYAWLYGASDKKIGQTAGHADGKAEAAGAEIRKRLIAAIPGLDKLMESIEKQAKKGYVKAIDGRRIEIRGKHATLNMLLQSCGSILVKMAQCYMNAKIRKLKLDAWQVISYHDEVQLDCHPDHTEQAGQLFIEGLQWAGKHVGFRCPLDGEVKIGNSWADTH